jgi:hypothetical protein
MHADLFMFSNILIDAAILNRLFSRAIKSMNCVDFNLLKNCGIHLLD